MIAEALESREKSFVSKTRRRTETITLVNEPVKPMIAKTPVREAAGQPSLESLNLKVRAYAILKDYYNKHGVPNPTVSDLTDLYRTGKLQTIPCVGRMVVSEIETKLAANGCL